MWSPQRRWTTGPLAGKSAGARPWRPLTAGIFPECWERNFPSLGAPGATRLFRSAVLVAGLGGLGLSGRTPGPGGVGRLLLADGDHFTPANLNRQLLATRETLGQSKAAVTARRLREISPAILAEPIRPFPDSG